MEKEISNNKEKIPKGIKLVMVLFGLSAVSLMISIFKTPIAQIGPIVLIGFSAYFLSIIYTIVYIEIFAGISFRKKWAFYLGIGWNIVLVIISLLNYLYFTKDKTIYDSAYSKTLSPENYALITENVIKGTLVSGIITATIFAILINFILVKNKDYFNS